MNKADNTFFGLFKARWNRENMSSALQFTAVIYCIVIMVLAVSVFAVTELKELTEWLRETEDGVKLYFKDFAFHKVYSEYQVVNGEAIAVECGWSVFPLDDNASVLFSLICILPFAVLLLFACRKIKGKVVSEEDIPYFTKRLIGRSRLASLSGFFSLAAVVACTVYVYVRWNGIPVSEYDSAMLIDSASLSSWYFVLTMLVGTVSAVMSSRVYFHIGRVLKDDAYGRGKAIEGCETAAKVLNIAFAVLIMLSAIVFFSGSCNDSCANLLVIDPRAVCALAAGVMLLVLNRHRAILAENCIAIAGRIKTAAD